MTRIAGFALGILLVFSVPAAVLSVSRWVNPWIVVWVLAGLWFSYWCLALWNEFVDYYVWGTWTNGRRAWPRIHFERYTRNNARVLLWSLPFSLKIHAWSMR